MKHDKWMFIPELNELINLRNCVNIYPGVNNGYDNPYQLRFKYLGSTGESVVLWFKDELMRDNLMKIIRGMIQPTEVDITKEPIIL